MRTPSPALPAITLRPPSPCAPTWIALAVRRLDAVPAVAEVRDAGHIGADVAPLDGAAVGAGETDARTGEPAHRNAANRGAGGR